MKHFWQTIKDKLTKIDYFFLGFIALMTLFFAFAIPPMQKPDETIHYQKSVDMAYGNFFSDNKNDRKLVNEFFLNWSTYIESQKIAHQYNEKFYLSDLKKSIDKFSNKKVFFHGTGLPTTGYFISSFGIRIGSLFNNHTGVLIGFYLGRLSNFLFFFFSVLVALYLIPKNYKYLLFAFLLFPMLLHQAGAISYDSFLNSLIVIIFSYLINLAMRFKRNDKIKKKEFFIVLLLLTIITLVKSGYYLLFLLIFLLPFWKLFKNKIAYFLPIIICLISIYCFFSQTTRGFSYSNDSSWTISFQDGHGGVVSTGQQMKLIKENPLFLKTVIIDTMFKKDVEYFETLIGVYGALDAPLSFTFCFLFSIAIIMLIIYQVWLTKNVVLFSWWQLLLIFVITFTTFGAITMSFYFTWTPVGNNIIEGVQGRYFLPLLPFIFLFFVELAKKIGLKKFVNYFMIGSLLATVLFSIYVVYKRYWDYQELVTVKIDSQASESAILKEK